MLVFLFPKRCITFFFIPNHWIENVFSSRNIACQARSVKLPSKRISRTNKQKTFSYKTKPEYWMEKIVLKPTWISKHNTKPFLLIRYLLVFDAHLSSRSLSLHTHTHTHTHNVISSSIMYIQAGDDDDDSAESMPGFKISSIPELSLASLSLSVFLLSLSLSLSISPSLPLPPPLYLTYTLTPDGW